ncbi:MAG: hypothetical protein WBB44_06270 [Candidatus Nanopelagicales bacterium]
MVALLTWGLDLVEAALRAVAAAAVKVHMPPRIPIWAAAGAAAVGLAAAEVDPWATPDNFAGLMPVMAVLKSPRAREGRAGVCDRPAQVRKQLTTADPRVPPVNKAG